MTTGSYLPDSEDLLRPPTKRVTPQAWLHENLFNSWFNTALTLISAALLIAVISGFLSWAFGAARWAVIPANLKIFMTGTYPGEQLFRVWLVLGIALALMGLSAGVWQGLLLKYTYAVAIFCGILTLLPLGQARLYLGVIVVAMIAGIALGWRRSNWQRWVLLAWLLSLPVMAILLLGGGITGMRLVSTRQWSGLLLTFVLTIWSLILGFPLGVLLALGRSNATLPVVRLVCTFTIELIRGIPLTVILFAASLLLPFFLAGARIDLVFRATVGLTLFTAVYMAEDIRGGLQSIPSGQAEAARALGLNPAQITFLVVLPQALRTSIPSLVGSFLTMFKDTSLVFIIGLIDLLGAGRAAFAQPEWLGTQAECLIFVGVIYAIFCFAISYASQQLEKSLGLGDR
ncbi:amino acid ABC transporter permease [Leptolyngbya sp. FACHB-261]|uniref:amino acid ABC transporter permease n=1 Tax=Leptolyngbya sp. FACHB-261 TaxID=2692806 RepID=UPI0016898687|nr:amino acid ABC transporter permease [Leptolyngbya sp. FACHB-261]MBD2100798.1 amino acid ABC transporter permease [Leptolyngbya sp. FACHB-261]